jgi:ketosteroid isomerase-like protein
MTEVDDFLQSVLPKLIDAETALHDGDAAPRIALWSRTEPVTLFGAILMNKGWSEIEPIFQRLATQFSHCTSYAYEVVAAGASGDLAYIAGFERTTASVAGGPPLPYSLRVTTIFRREHGEWKVVHRHADPVSAFGSTRDQMQRLGTTLQSR